MKDKTMAQEIYDRLLFADEVDIAEVDIAVITDDPVRAFKLKDGSVLAFSEDLSFLDFVDSM